MKEKIGKILKNYKKAFVPEKDYLHQNNSDVSAVVNKRIAETNCRRILSISPILFVLYIVNIMLLTIHNKAQYLPLSITITVALIVYTLFFDILVYWIMFLNQIDNSEEIWKFKLIHRVFWPIWFVAMVIVSCIQIDNGYIGVTLVLTFIIYSLLPLYNLAEFSANLVFTIAVMIIMVLYDHNQEIAYVSTKMEILNFVAMQIIGFVAQRMQLMLWMSREYLYMEAFVDPLTQLLNRRGGDAVFQKERQTYANETEIGIIMFDIDYFKRYNDTFGHGEGDICLRTVGDAIRENMKERTKLMIRHGGEEFVTILFQTNEKELLQCAEELRKAVFEKHMKAPTDEVAEYVTISIGAAMERIPGEDFRYEKLLSAADEALYKAKQSGKNCVVYAGR